MKTNLLSIFLLLALISLPACQLADAVTTGPAPTVDLPTGTPVQPQEVTGTPNPGHLTATPGLDEQFQRLAEKHAEQVSTPEASPKQDDPIWVASPEDRAVLRIDPAANAVAAVIHVDGRPELVELGEGALWVLDQENRKVFRIDPAANQVTGEIALPEGFANALAAGSGYIWVGMTEIADITRQIPGEAPAPPRGAIMQLDPQTLEVLDRFTVQPVSQIEVSGSLVWVLSRGEIDTPVQVIDYENNLGMAVPFRNVPEWFLADAFAIDPGNIWLFSSAYNKIFHGRPDGKIHSAVELENRQPTGYADLLLTEDSLWAATPWGSVLRIDPVTNHILLSIDLNVPLSGLIRGHNAVWVSSQQTGSIFRIDPTSGDVVAQISTGSALQPTVVPTSTPRVIVWQPCPDAPTSRLNVGDIAYVTKDPPLPNRVRAEPNRESEIIGYINPAGSMEILEGPACSDGWVWWRVKNANVEGWTAEGDESTYWLIPLFR